MNNLIVFLFFLIAAIPGIYLALRNDFIIIKNKKYNNFFTRAMYTTLPTTVFILIPCALLIGFFPDIFPETTNTIVNTFGTDVVVLAMPAIFSALTILLAHKFILRKGIPPEYWQDFEKYELYVYFPNIKINAGDSYGTKLIVPDLKKSEELKKPTQIGELIIDFKSMRGKDIVFGSFGEIIVSEKALNLFKNNNLTGFREQAVRNWKDSKVKTNEKYFQLISTHTMPPISDKTKLSKFLTIGVTIVDRLVYYDKTVLPASDFNQSFEIFGKIAENAFSYN